LIYSKNDGTLLGGYDSSGNRIPDTIIQGANNGTLPTVSSATAVTPAQVSDIQNIYQTMTASGSSPADIATAMAQKGYTADQVTSVFGPDSASTVQQAYKAAYDQATGNVSANVANTSTTSSSTATGPVAPLVSPIGNSNFIDLGSNQYLNTTTGDIVDNTGATVYKMPPGTVAGGTNLASLATDLANAGLPSDVANRAEEAINSQEATKYVNGVPDQVKVIADPEGRPTIGISTGGGPTSYGYTVEDSNGNMYRIQSTDELKPGDVINDVVAHKGDYGLESYTPPSNTNESSNTSATISNAASNIANVSTGNVANISTGNVDLTNVANVQANNVSNIANINTNVANLANLSTGNVANISNVSSNIGNVANITTGNVSNVSGPIIPSNVGNVSNATTNTISNVSNTITNSSNIANVSTGNIANISNVSSNVGNMSNVSTNNLSNVSNTSSNIGNVANVSTGNIANISNVSSNVANTSNVIVGHISNVANLIANGFSTNANISSNLIANTLGNIISNVSNANVGNANIANVANVANISNANVNVANANISNANISNIGGNLIPIIPNSNVSNNSSNTATDYHYTGGNVSIPIGLNPGWITPSMFQPFYANAGTGQSNYFWGSHPFQAGNTFNSALYNTVAGAPTTPYGIQQVAGPVKPA